MAQRLVRTICNHCKESYEPTKEDLELIGIDRSQLINNVVYKGNGCSHCRNTGYHGRTGIFELIYMSRKIRGLIFENANEDKIRIKALEEGMVTLRNSGIRKIISGETTIAEIIRSTVENI